MEEDCNSLAADCIVISCCCHCMVLQIIVFVTVGLPRKLVKTCKRKLRCRKNRRRESMTVPSGEEFCYESDNGDLGFREGFGDEEEVVQRVFGEGMSWCNLGEVERVLGEFVERGEFGFGSFWGRSFNGGHGCDQEIVRDEDDRFELVQFRLIEMRQIGIDQSYLSS